VLQQVSVGVRGRCLLPADLLLVAGEARPASSSLPGMSPLGKVNYPIESVWVPGVIREWRLLRLVTK
jgi:hypothetical protein